MLVQEHDHLMKDCVKVTSETFRDPDRKLPWWLPAASAVAKTYL